MRVFYDRLVDDDDRAWLFSCVRNVTNVHLDDDFDQLFAHLAGPGEGHVTETDLCGLVFCDFGDVRSDAKNYEEVRDVEQLRHVVENHLVEFNGVSKKPMDLVMFRSANVMLLIFRLRKPGGV